MCCITPIWTNINNIYIFLYIFIYIYIYIYTMNIYIKIYIYIYGIFTYLHLMVVPVKFSFWFNFNINLQTSVKLTADKMQYLLTKKEPEGAYNTDLHELQKKMSLKLPYDCGK